ncbi:MAG: hypothetical protein RL398_1923 [Planctomycetota bacterium]|jgi:hypothetical protein
MRALPLVIAILAAAATAKADKYWLSHPDEAARAAEGSRPESLEGVLVAEQDGIYEIRVVGGTLFLAKSAVHRIDKDDLTVAAIEAAEREAAAAADAANAARRVAIEASVTGTRRRAKAVEASASADAPATARRTFDPVLGVLRGVVAETDPDVGVMFPQRRDRSELKTLRRMRRLK